MWNKNTKIRKSELKSSSESWQVVVLQGTKREKRMAGDGEKNDKDGRRTEGLSSSRSDASVITGKAPFQKYAI